MPSARSRDTFRLTFLLSIICGVAAAAPAPNQGTPAAASGKAAMRARCLKAVSESGEAVAPKPSGENAYDAGPGNYLFEFKQPDGGSFFCQICDETDARTECGSLGLTLNHRPAQGEARALPAELDRKCVYFLQKELSRKGHTGLAIDKEMVARVKVTPDHTDARFVYHMELDGGEYRCVIRKSDGDFRVERHQGNDWRALAAGVMF